MWMLVQYLHLKQNSIFLATFFTCHVGNIALFFFNLYTCCLRYIRFTESNLQQIILEAYAHRDAKRPTNRSFLDVTRSFGSNFLYYKYIYVVNNTILLNWPSRVASLFHWLPYISPSSRRFPTKRKINNF